MMSNNRVLNVILSVGFFGIVVYFLSPIITPFFLGALLAYLSNPLVSYLADKHIPRTISIFFIFIIVFFLLIAVFMLVIPLIQQQVVVFVQKIPEIIVSLQTTLVPWIDNHLHTNVGHYLNPVTLKKALAQHAEKISHGATAVFKTVTTSTFALLDFFMNLVLIPVVGFYLMRDWPQIMQNIRNILPPASVKKIIAVAQECDEVVGAFFKGQLLVMFGLAIIYSAGLWLVGLDLAIFVGLLSGLLAIVPYLGFTTGIVVASLAMYFQVHDFMPVVYVWGVYAGGQIIESMVLTPLLVGDKIGLHPVAVIFAVLAGGLLFGFLGVLLALPVAAILLVIVKKMIDHAISV